MIASTLLMADQVSQARKEIKQQLDTTRRTPDSKRPSRSRGVSVEVGIRRRLLLALRRHLGLVGLPRDPARPKLFPLQIVLRERRLDTVRVAPPSRVIIAAHRTLLIFEGSRSVP